MNKGIAINDKSASNYCLTRFYFVAAAGSTPYITKENQNLLIHLNIK
jgi:hypothetical protein